MATITMLFIDNEPQEFSSDLDYESIAVWARNVVENNDNIEQIVVDFNEGRMIFEAIN